MLPTNWFFFIRSITAPCIKIIFLCFLFMSLTMDAHRNMFYKWHYHCAFFPIPFGSIHDIHNLGFEIRLRIEDISFFCWILNVLSSLFCAWYAELPLLLFYLLSPAFFVNQLSSSSSQVGEPRGLSLDHSSIRDLRCSLPFLSTTPWLVAKAGSHISGYSETSPKGMGSYWAMHTDAQGRRQYWNCDSPFLSGEFTSDSTGVLAKGRLMQ